MLKPRKILLVDLSTHPNPTVRPERPALEGSNPQEERGSVSFYPLAYFDFDLLGPASVDVVLGSEVRLLSIRTWWDGSVVDREVGIRIRSGCRC